MSGFACMDAGVGCEQDAVALARIPMLLVFELTHYLNPASIDIPHVCRYCPELTRVQFLGHTNAHFTLLLHYCFTVWAKANTLSVR